jgi:hypothetical protein
MALALGALGCSQGNQGNKPPPSFDGASRAKLLDPATCANCHPDHYADWSMSMHAHAADDPVFLAMNARGQRETNGALGTFCVGCHAPMAVRDGKTKDGTDLASLPPAYRQGITCFFCHSIASVDGTHNAAVTVADDLVMRGEYADPLPNTVHRSTYSKLQDGTQPESASACGACHDIVVPHSLGRDAGADDAGAAIERTFAEWRASPFSPDDAGVATTCAASACHMQQSRTPVVIAPGVPTDTTKRYRHDHDFPAVDVDLTAEAGAPGASLAAQRVQAKLANSVFGDLCVTDRGGIRVVLDAVALGHEFPSGASQDRRLWIEVNAYQGSSATPYYSSGRVPAGGSPADVDAQADPDMWLMRDCMFGADGGQVSMFWQAASTEGNALPPFSLNRAATSHRVRFFPQDRSPLSPAPDRVTLDVWLQPIGSDVLGDLLATHDLDPAVAAAMPTFHVPLGQGLSPQLVWTGQAAADAGLAYREDVSGVTCVGTLPNPGAQSPAPAHTMCFP